VFRTVTRLLYRGVSLHAERNGRHERDEKRDGLANHCDPPEAVTYRIQQPFSDAFFRDSARRS
jgi:hypothetical protein